MEASVSLKSFWENEDRYAETTLLHNDGELSVALEHVVELLFSLQFSACLSMIFADILRNSFVNILLMNIGITINIFFSLMRQVTKTPINVNFMPERHN